MTKRRAFAQIERDLLHLGVRDRAFEALDLARRIGVMAGGEDGMAYGLEPHEEAFRVEFLTGWKSGSSSFAKVLDAHVRARPSVLAYDPTRPAAWQCNTALRTSDLVRRGAPTSRAGSLFDALGVGGCDQLRVLVCEGRDVLAWVGTFRREPFTDLERRKLARIAPALRARLLFERLVGAEERARLTLEAAVAQIPSPAFVVSRRGRVEGHNEAGRAMLASERRAVDEAIGDALAGRARAAARVVPLGGRGELGALVVLPTSVDATEVQTRVELVARREHLTAQQARVVGKLAEGLSNREIAAALAISARTVESHLQAIFDKLGVSSRAGVMATVLEARAASG